MTHPFTANTRSIAELFSDDYVLTVPQYHRTYAWPESLARAFLDDLLVVLPPYSRTRPIRNVAPAGV